MKFVAPSVTVYLTLKMDILKNLLSINFIAAARNISNYSAMRLRRANFGARRPLDVCPAPTEAERRPQADLRRGFVILKYRALSPNRGFSLVSGGEQR